MKPVLLAFLLVGASINAHASQLAKYNTAGHPKAKGVSLTVKYPSDWARQEGDRPNIVQKFRLDLPEEYSLQAIIQINAGAPKGDITHAFALGKWAENLGKLGRVTNVRATTIEAEPAYMLDLYIIEDRAGLEVHIKNRVLWLTYNGSLISLSCGVAALRGNLTAEFDRHLPECSLFLASLVLVDRW